MELISDSMCAVNHAKMQKGEHKMSDHDCTVACVNMMGQRDVLAAGDKVHQIANQDFAALKENAGSTVHGDGPSERRWQVDHANKADTAFRQIT
jgi:hypothetical protein